MNKKVKTNLSVWMILGLVFAPLGLCFGIAGTICFFADIEAGSILFYCFFPIGLCFFIPGMIMIILSLIKIRRIKNIVHSGYYITGKINSIQRNYMVRINGMCPFYVTAEYQDQDGCVHIFKSRNLYYNPENIIAGEYVKIYVRQNNYRHYYMDIDEILPQVKFHS